MDTLSLQVDQVELAADLHPVPDANGLVVFAHGSGSSRRSPRNVFVAEQLQQAGFATLLFDLLTAAEERRDGLDASLRFDIDLLGGRLTDVVDQAPRLPEVGGLPIGLFGASTGAAAALRTAADRPDLVKSVVSRGGRPDLTGDALERTQAPALLLVGGRDHQVILFNEAAAGRMPVEPELSIVDGATHLFEEPGALEEVARRATGWFGSTLARQ
ncbi:dienelactone hydrolase family protein [Arthrobacter castelli]|uniref:dienelactone hydrolase family protein n=1 Tax=Arthrobacter castelli TaxID=271431 RepID=UPI0004073DA7|nr:alpha/beta fold hydrolase [Arthrobacter castelli]